MFHTVAGQDESEGSFKAQLVIQTLQPTEWSLNIYKTCRQGHELGLIETNMTLISSVIPSNDKEVSLC